MINCLNETVFNVRMEFKVNSRIEGELTWDFWTRFSEHTAKMN